MNTTLIDPPLFPGTSTEVMVPRFLLLGVEGAASEKSARLGYPIASISPVEAELADFDRPPIPESTEGKWTEAMNQRRCDLIDRKYLGNLTLAEARELERLQSLMLRCRQRVAPLPVEQARQLYEELLAEANASRSPHS